MPRYAVLMNALNFLIATGALQGILLSIVLAMMAITRKNPPLIWLAGFVAAFSCLVTGDVLLETRVIFLLPHLYQLFDALIFWVGPLCFGYVRALLGLPRWRWWVALAHFFPGVLLYAMLLPNILLGTQAKRLVIAQDLSAAPIPGPDIFVLTAGLLVLAYLLRSIWLMRLYWQDLEGEFSNTAPYKLRWLAQLLSFCAVVWAFWMVSILTGAHWADLVSQLGLGVGIYTLGYRGLRQVQLWASPKSVEIASVAYTDLPPSNPPVGIEAPRTMDAIPARQAALDVAQTEPNPAQSQALPERPKYARTGVSAQDMSRLGQQLRDVMAKELLFLEPELSLSDLAKRLQISRHTLSQTFNVHVGQSFFEYINSLRVAEVQRCFVDPAFAEQSILQIALASGFASKATFNATFKRLTGQTPSAARQLVSKT
jgi:AraC-like DNA-binding protein